MKKDQIDLQVAQALAALDTMATVWAAKVGLRDMVRLIMLRQMPDCEDRLVALLKQAHVEGLYAGGVAQENWHVQHADQSVLNSPLKSKEKS